MKKVTLETVLRNSFWSVASRMPGLKHWPDRAKPYDVKVSQVAEWLSKQPEALEWMVHKAIALGVIVYDAQTGVWHGVATEKGRELFKVKQESSAATEKSEP